MRIFESNGKINFIDEEDVFVGYDYTQDCCEVFGYRFATEPLECGEESTINEDTFPLDGYLFDKNFFAECGDHDGGGSCSFRLRKDDSEIFLTLYNHHNGYYGHGFAMTHGASTAYHGTL